MTNPRNKILISLTLITIIIFTSCINLPKDNAQENTSDSPLLQAMNIVILLEQRNFIELAEFVHPDKGVLFSPYTYIDASNCLVFNNSQIKDLFSNSQIYTWGVFDGSGKPIEFNFEQYYNRFIFDQNYSNPHIIGNNIEISQGNMINNIKDVFPNAYFIEFYFKGFDPQYEGMDWKSLKIVMEDLNGKWYLVGIIHGEWTI